MKNKSETKQSNNKKEQINPSIHCFLVVQEIQGFLFMINWLKPQCLIRQPKRLLRYGTVLPELWCPQCGGREPHLFCLCQSMWNGTLFWPYLVRPSLTRIMRVLMMTGKRWLKELGCSAWRRGILSGKLDAGFKYMRICHGKERLDFFQVIPMNRVKLWEGKNQFNVKTYL